MKVEGKSLYITRNRANSSGGGIHASNSSVTVEGTVHFIGNKAENGRRISLEENADLRRLSAEKGHNFNFAENNATHYSGALYVADETHPDKSAAITAQIITPSTECFSRSVFINISDNSAGLSGSNLFGGPLDRCTVHHQFYLYFKNEFLGITNFLNSSNIDESELDAISSHPV